VRVSGLFVDFIGRELQPFQAVAAKRRKILGNHKAWAATADDAEICIPSRCMRSSRDSNRGKLVKKFGQNTAFWFVSGKKVCSCNGLLGDTASTPT